MPAGGAARVLIDELIGERKVLGRAQARNAELMVAFADARTGVDRQAISGLRDAGVDARYTAGEFAANEVSMACSTSKFTAQRVIAMTRRVRAQAPDVWDAWLAGDIDQDKVERVNRALRRLQLDSSKALLNALVVDVAVCKSPEILARWLNQFILETEKNLQDERLRRSLDDRFVSVRPDLDGMSFLTAELSAVDAQAIDQVLTALAGIAEPGDTRTVQQRRADALVDVLLGRVTNGCHVVWDTNTDIDDHLDDPDTEAPGTDTPDTDTPGREAVDTQDDPNATDEPHTDGGGGSSRQRRSSEEQENSSSDDSSDSDGSSDGSDDSSEATTAAAAAATTAATAAATAAAATAAATATATAAAAATATTATARQLMTQIHGPQTAQLPPHRWTVPSRPTPTPGRPGPQTPTTRPTVPGRPPAIAPGRPAATAPGGPPGRRGTPTTGSNPHQYSAPTHAPTSHPPTPTAPHYPRHRYPQPVPAPRPTRPAAPGSPPAPAADTHAHSRSPSASSSPPPPCSGSATPPANSWTDQHP